MSQKSEEKLDPQFNVEDASRVAVEVAEGTVNVLIDKEGNSAVEKIPEGITDEQKPEFLSRVNTSLQNALLKAQETRKHQNETEQELENLRKFKQEVEPKLKKLEESKQKDIVPSQGATTYKNALYAEMKKEGVDITDPLAVEEFMATPKFIDIQSNAYDKVNEALIAKAQNLSQETGMQLQKKQDIINACSADPNSQFNPSDVIATAKAKGIYNNPNFSAKEIYELHKTLHPTRRIDKHLNMIDALKVKPPVILKTGTVATSLRLTPLAELSKDEAKVVLADETDPRTIEFNKGYKRKF